MSISVTQRALRRSSRPALRQPASLGRRRTRAALLFLLPGLALLVSLLTGSRKLGQWGGKT